MVTSVEAQTKRRVAFNGVKVFSATMFNQRGQLGEAVTAWLAAHPQAKLVDVVITQSSDARFHCLAISLFYFTPGD